MLTSHNSNYNFIYFLVSEGHQKLLKEEIKIKYPHFKISYSKESFLTYKYKNDSFQSLSLLLDYVDNLDIIFAYSYGISLGKINNSSTQHIIENISENISEILSIFKNKNIIFNSYNLHDVHAKILDLIKQKSKHNNSANTSDIVLEAIKTNENEIFIGIHKFGHHKTLINNYLDHQEIITKDNIPSRAYFKIADAITLAQIKIKESQTVLDIGSSPGGISYYFLKHGLKVIGIDAAEMHPSCICNKNFTHLKIPLEKVKCDQLSKYLFDLIVIDINLDPMYVLSIFKKIFTNNNTLSKIKEYKSK